jgi:hypothetical protein
MHATDPRRTPEDVARIGSELLEREVRPILRPEHQNKFVAIDIGTRDYEIDEDDYTAVMRLRLRHPEAEIWLGRIGQPAAYSMR